MSRVVHFYTVPANGDVFETIVPSGTEILSAEWRPDPDTPVIQHGDVVLYVEKPVANGAAPAYRGERKLKVFLVPTGVAFDQADYAFVGTVAQPGYRRSGFWHVYACLTEVDA